MGRVCWRDWCRNCDKICCRWLTNCFARGNIYRQSARRAQKNMGVFPSGQWGQTVNLLLSASVVRIHPRPPNKKNPNLFPIGEGFGFFVFFGYDNEGSREGNKGK